MIKSILRRYQSAFSDLPRDAWLLSAVVLINRAGTMVLPFFAIYATRQLGFSPKFTGLLISTYGMGTILGSYFGGWACNRINSMWVQFISLLAAGFGFFCWFLCKVQLNYLCAYFLRA